jgi:hypothetical protein
MAEKIKKGFYVAPPLARAWDEWLTNKQDNSASAAAAMFVFMLLPPEVRELAKQLAKIDRIKTRRDLTAAQREFRETVETLSPEQITYEAIQRALIATATQKQSRGRKPEGSEKSE